MEKKKVKKSKSEKVKKHIGFQPLMQSKKSLDSTIDWYLQNAKWWRNIPFEHVKNPVPWK